MAMETRDTSENVAKRKAIAQYFSLEIEGHYECCALLTKPLGKSHSKCRLSSVSCCPGRVSHLVVRQKAASHINDDIEPGYWSWTDEGPRRLDISVREGSCEEKRDALMAKIEPRHSNLKQNFEAAKAGQNPKLRTQSFQRILELIEVAAEDDRDPNTTLEQEVLFACHGETFERKIRSGIATLRSASAEEQRSLFCRVVDYRANPDKSLWEIFDEEVTHRTSKNAKAQWLPRFSASTATIVARAYDAQFSESGVRGKEREVIRKAKLAHIVHQTIDELIAARQVTYGPQGPIPGPVIGVNALIICSALNEKPCFFSATERQMPSGSIPAFARHLAGLLRDIDWSNLPATISVAFPLFLISWAMRKRFSEVCDNIGLPNLAGLELDVTAQLDRVEMRWQTATRDWKRMTKAEINMAKMQLGEDMRILLGDLQRLCLGQSDASEHLRHGHSPASRNAECAGEAGASAEGSLFVPHQLSIDSGYVSNAGSQQLRNTAAVASSAGASSVSNSIFSHHNVLQSSATARSEVESGEDSVHVAAGQKRPQVRDHATSKRRHRLSAAETAEASENLESTEDSVDSENTGDSEASQNSQVSDSGLEPPTTPPALRSPPKTGGTAPTTNATTDPSQDDSSEELAEIEDFAEFSVGIGMAGEDYWAGSGMDLNDVNLATPTGVPDFLRAEQPCESPRPVAGSENEHQAE